MSKVVRVLALNDDNHSCMFSTPDTTYSNAKEFMDKCLLKPHTETYELRLIYICDQPEGLSDMSEEEFNDAFCALEDDPTDLPFNRYHKRCEIFEKMWEHAERNFHYV